MFGGAHFYDADPFHEGGATSDIDLPAAGRAIQKAMGDATWVLQSWGKNPRQEMVDALDKNKMLVLDLYCEDHENWRLRNNFNGAPWLWCAINCFGGNMKVGGTAGVDGRRPGQCADRSGQRPHVRHRRAHGSHRRQSRALGNAARKCVAHERSRFANVAERLRATSLRRENSRRRTGVENSGRNRL